MVNHMRHTRGHTRNRRSHHALSGAGFILCANCGQPKQKHLACSHCGFYKTKDVLGLKAKADKAEANDKSKKSTRSK
jgi:large subunit ribosomal protein L32